jgi:hypothetical protein
MRARNIKPNLCEDDRLAEAGPLGVLLYAVLPMQADREGRLEDRPKRIKALAFPYFDDVDIDDVLDALAATGKIVRYEVEGSRFIQIVNWHQDQRPHHNEVESVIPPCPALSPRSQGLSPSSARALDQSEQHFALIPDTGLMIPDRGSLIADPPTPERRNGGYTAEFESFWALCPRKEPSNTNSGCILPQWHDG